MQKDRVGNGGVHREGGGGAAAVRGKESGHVIRVSEAERWSEAAENWQPQKKRGAVKPKKNKKKPKKCRKRGENFQKWRKTNNLQMGRGGKDESERGAEKVVVKQGKGVQMGCTHKGGGRGVRQKGVFPQRKKKKNKSCCRKLAKEDGDPGHQEGGGKSPEICREKTSIKKGGESSTSQKEGAG